MSARKLPDVAYLRECLDYDPDTGLFRWRERPERHFKKAYAWKAWNARHSGHVTGTALPVGYLYIGIDYCQHYAHRLAWLLVHGEPVPSQIDHIDRDRGNNRISNLRAADHADNGANATHHHDSTTGVKGVRLRKRDGTFQAYIARRGRFYVLGNFTTLEAAKAARRKAAEHLHGEFARHD